MTIIAATITVPNPVAAANLPVVTPVMPCANLLSVDFSDLLDALGTKINSAVTSTPPTTPIPTPQCIVSGYVAPNVQFTVRLPTENWKGRLVMRGCGGYCGNLITLPVAYGASAADGCPGFASGELAVAGHNGGHVGQENGSRRLASIADGAWAINDPEALVDFFYASNHKATVAVKAIMQAFYGQTPRFAYFDGCSSGGRAGLHVAQRYPNDYNGILAGSPTIDNTTENTFLHAWNVRVNSNPDGTSILTSDKIPSLAQAVLSACADSSGMIPDPRTCHFNAATIVCTGADSPSCLTAAQAQVANLLWRGPVDENGMLLSPGDLPHGSELAWAGSVALAKGVVFSSDASGEFAFSYDFPNYMSKFHLTGITNQNIQFTSSQFAFLDTMSHLNDPTNPDLSAFAKQGESFLCGRAGRTKGLHLSGRSTTMMRCAS